MAIDIPHFKYPFQFGPPGQRVQYTEQDSDDELLDCIEVLLSTVQGERIEIPEYGIADQTFRQGGVDTGHILSQIRRYEDRADVNLEAGVIEDLVQRVGVLYRGGTRG
jgi:phage baseplate assembly protein W